MADLAPDPGAPLLILRGVAAGYRGRAVVTGVDLTLRRGEILGLLGANGSGKSTLVKAFTGQLPLLAGSVAVDGVDMAASPEKAKALLGLAVDVGEVPTALTGRQYLELVASIRRCAADAWPVADLPSLLAIERWIARPIATYSLGTRMKISILAALLGAPPLLVFDESLNGLDPVAAYRMKRLIADLAASGRHGIVLSTHVVETIPTVCTRAMFLAEGGIAENWDAVALAAAAASPGGFEAHVMAALTRRAGIAA
ncbi:MAG: ABC transporter ATP-binding protein [Bauldia sp.]|nr:ABC transporter ATP-binding protein [Bauldia sp.]